LRGKRKKKGDRGKVKGGKKGGGNGNKRSLLSFDQFHKRGREDGEFIKILRKWERECLWDDK